MMNEVLWFFPSIRQSAAVSSSSSSSSSALQHSSSTMQQSGLSFAREMWRFAIAPPSPSHQVNAREAGRNKAERSAIALHRDARPATAPGILTHISLSAFCICRDPYSSFPTGPTGATTYRPPHLFFLCFNKHPYSQPWPPKL